MNKNLTYVLTVQLLRFRFPAEKKMKGNKTYLSVKAS